MYKCFNTFVLRTPTFSMQRWHEKLKDVSDGNTTNLLSDKVFLEALFLASPMFYRELIFNDDKLGKKEEKRLYAILRYLTRMSWRCTPFGLFAGCSVGVVTDSNVEITLPEIRDFKRHTRLDMNYLCALIQNLESKESVRANLKYYPNTSIYQMGGKLRYVEYNYTNAKRKHTIVAVDNSEYLQLILRNAENGCSIRQLSALIVDDEITLDEASDFVEELINNQILISELEPNITGRDILDSLIDNLKTSDIEPELTQHIIDIRDILMQINSGHIGESINLYQMIVDVIDKIEVPYEPNFLFQTDMMKPVVTATISKNMIDEIVDAVTFLNKITPFNINPNLNSFANAFVERYEDREVALLRVLDNELGVGYLQRDDKGDVSPLLDNMVVHDASHQQQQQLPWDNVQSILHRKYMEALSTKSYEIVLSEHDFEFSSANWDNLPPTVSAMCEVFTYDNGKKLIHLSSFGGSSAANLLGRFCHVDNDIHDYVVEITDKDKEILGDLIIAEIVHLPESRIGNVLFRPVVRDYEIPYLAKSSVGKDFQIPLSDLYVSVRDGDIILRSKRLNKRIVPRLTTAHNYSHNSMPIYQFLCDLQMSGLRSGVGFRWSSLANEYDFLPRVMYKNIILSMARWIINVADIKIFISQEDNIDGLMQWRIKKQIPRYVVLPDGDNKLFVDMDNMLSVKTLFSVVKKRKSFYLDEFPFDEENAIVKDVSGNSYANEIILGFYKSK